MHVACSSSNVEFFSLTRVSLFLLERGFEASGISVALEAKGSAFVRDDCVPVGEDEYRWYCEFRVKSTDGVFHYGAECSGFTKETINVRIRRGMIDRNSPL